AKNVSGLYLIWTLPYKLLTLKAQAPFSGLLFRAGSSTTRGSGVQSLILVLAGIFVGEFLVLNSLVSVFIEKTALKEKRRGKIYKRRVFIDCIVYPSIS